jgi:hypothetical protein
LKGDNIFVKKGNFKQSVNWAKNSYDGSGSIVVIYFWVLVQKKRKQINRKNNNNEKSMLERLENDQNWLRRFKNTKIGI